MSSAGPPKKSLGQHWLRDAASLEAMCEAAEVQLDDIVLEIGPGLGTLTKRLLDWEARVIALEFDESLIPGLLASFDKPIREGQLQVQQGDIRTYDFTALPHGYKVVANIPYYLTSHLIQNLSESNNPPEAAVLLIQKEVAERVAAKPGDMSLLSVTAQFYWNVSLGPLVPAELFTPPPKVDSQILILQRKTTQLLPDADVKPFFRLVKAGYSQRRKTLLNSLGGGLHLPRETISAHCAAAAIEPGRRAQTLSLEEWCALYKAWQASN